VVLISDYVFGILVQILPFNRNFSFCRSILKMWAWSRIHDYMVCCFADCMTQIKWWLWRQ